MKEEIEEIDRETLNILPEEKLIIVELVPKNPELISKKKIQMKKEVAEELIELLRKNTDLSAFIPLNMIVIWTDIVVRYLNIDPVVKSVKQNMRHFRL